MSNTKKITADAVQNPVAVATIPAPIEQTPVIKKFGKAKLVGFRYLDKWCTVSLADGTHGIVGDADRYPFGVMLTLKGSGIELSYQHTGEKTVIGKDGVSRTYQRYTMEWSLE